jgi:hypothetical protein
MQLGMINSQNSSKFALLNTLPVLYFWPVLLNLDARIIGRIGDATSGGGVWWNWAVKRSALGFNNPWDHKGYWTNHPFYQDDFFVPLSLTQWFTQIPAWILVQISNPIIVHNLTIITGIVLCNFFTFKLLIEFKVDWLVAIILANSFTLSNFNQTKLLDHPIYIQSWVYVFIFYLFFKYEKTKTSQSLILVGSLLGLTNYVDGYFVYITFVVILTILIYEFISKENTSTYAWIKNSVIFLFSYFLIILPLIVLSLNYLQSEPEIFRSEEDFTGFSGRMSDLFTFNPDNKYLSKFWNLIGRSSELGIAGNESIHWINLSIILVTLLFILYLIKFKNLRVNNLENSNVWRFSIILMTISILFGLREINFFQLFSIELPGQIIFNQLPIWRVTSRIFLITHIAILIMIGLLSISIINKKKIKLLYLASLALALFLDLGIGNAWKVTYVDLTKFDSAYEWIRDNTPTDSIVFDSQKPSLSNESLTNQIIHNRKIINSRNSPFTGPAFSATSIGDSNSICILRALETDLLIGSKRYFQELENNAALKRIYPNDSIGNEILVYKIMNGVVGKYYVERGIGFFPTENYWNSGSWTSQIVSEIEVKPIYDDGYNQSMAVNLEFEYSSLEENPIRIYQNSKLLFSSIATSKLQSANIIVEVNAPITILSSKLNKVSQFISDSGDNRRVGIFLTNPRTSDCA